MEEILFRFPHLTENIFRRLKNKDLVKCRLVSTAWKTLLDDQKFMSLRTIKECTKNQVCGRCKQCEGELIPEH